MSHGRPDCVQCETDQELYTVTVVRESCVLHTARLDVTPKTTEQNRTVRTGKFEAKVTNNKNMRSRYCTIDRHDASRGLFATAELLVLIYRASSCQSVLKICNQILQWHRAVLLLCLNIQRLHVHTVL